MSKIVPSPRVKRHASPIADASGNESKKSSREQVKILEDAWLEALKHLTCPKWSKMLLVSRQLNGFVQRNVSRLPLATIYNVEMSLEQRNKTENAIIASDSPILPNQKIKWFKDRGINLYLPANIASTTMQLLQRNNAVVGFDFHFTEKRCFDLFIRADREIFNASILFKAEFSPHRNKNSLPSMAYFLKLIYDQSTFVKQLSMYSSMCPFDSKLKEVLFSNGKNRYIRCGSFKLQMIDSENLCFILRMSLSWLERNVRADMIEIPTFMEYDEEEICNVVSNFLLGSSWISSSQEVHLGHINMLGDFLRALIKKFQTLDTVQRTFPIMMFSGFLGTSFDGELKNLLSGNEELEDPEDDDVDSGDGRYGKTYTVSNGANRMQVEFVKPNNTGVFPRRQTTCRSARDRPVAIGRQLAAKSGRGPRPTYFDIRVTVRAEARNAIQ